MSTVVRERAVLRAVLEAGTGTVDERVGRALELVIEELGMQVAVLGRLRADRFEVTHRVTAPGTTAAPVATTYRWPDTISSLLVDGAVGPVVADVAAHPLLARHPHVVALGVGACASVPVLVDGQVWGALSCSSPVPTARDTDRDAATLRTVAQHLGAVVGSAPVVEDDVDDLGRVAHVLAAGSGLEPLGRQLLALLQEATGLESTFLTSVDWEADQQQVLYSLNAGRLDVPEGLEVEWSDTLCRRSLDQGLTATTDVPLVWGDSVAAAAMGIQTYVSVPVLDGDQAVVGTLCGVSASRVDVDDRDLATMRMFSVLISQQMAAQASADRHRRRAADMEARLVELDDLTLRDGLTGLSNRAGIHRWLETVLPGLRPGRDRLAVAFCDLDGFKQVNDTLGHAAGDEVLVRFGRALATIGHPGDLCGRLGGDEFVVAAVLPTAGATLAGWSARLRAAARCQVPGPTRSCGDEVAASVGVVSFDRRTTAAEALAAADRAMYEAKTARRA